MNNAQKTRIYKSVILFFCFIIFFNPVYGQENKAEKKEENILPTTLLATVNAYNISYKSELNGKISVSFDLENKKMVQPKIKYGIILKKIENEKETQIDRKVFEEVLTLSEKQMISKQVEYQVPYFSQGYHKIFLEIRTTDGLLLDYVDVGQVELNGNNQNIEIEQEKCSLSNSSSNLETWFQEGINYREKEVIFVKCPVVNKFSSAASAIPVVILQTDSPYGEIVSQEKYPAINFEPQEEKIVELKIPSFSNEKGYPIALTLMFEKEKQIISNKAEANLFLLSDRKEKAWILNVRFDKTNYVSGDTAEAIINWDGFAMNENGLISQIKEIPSKIELVSQSGISCINNSKNSTKSLVKNSDKCESKVALKINRDCPNPMLRLVLSDSNNNQLAAGEYEVAPQKIQAKILDTIKKGIIKYKQKIIISFLVLNILIIFWFIYKWIRKKIEYRNYIIPSILVAFGFCCIVPSQASAHTYYEPENRIIYNISTDKKDYFVSKIEDQKYILRSSAQRYYYQSGYPWAPGFHLSLQIKASGFETRWDTVLENVLLSYSQIDEAKAEFKTPRIQEYNSNSGPYLRSLVNGSFISGGEALAEFELNLRENGKCGKIEYLNEKNINSNACEYGNPGLSNDQKKFGQADVSGAMKWRCLNTEGTEDSDCQGSIKLDAQCGKAAEKAICNIEKYASSAQSLYSDYATYCDNQGWDIGEQKNLDVWGKVPDNFVSDSNEKGRSWTCKGIGGGTDASCKIGTGQKASCGPASNQPAKDLPKKGLCSAGLASSVSRMAELDSGKVGKKVEKWKWTCDFSEMSISYGCTVDCTAPVLDEKAPEKIP